MRGDAQDMDVSHETIDAVLDAVDRVDIVTFTGGEPSLNLGAIRYFLEQAEARGKLPASFYVATNGMANQMELACLLLEWYMKMEDQDSCAVSQSIDVFHDLDVDPSPIKGLKFYSPIKEHSTEYWDAEWVHRRGRAADNGIGREPPVRPDPMDALHENMEPDGDELRIDGTLCVSSNGNVTMDCDMSYEDIDDSPLCHVSGLRKLLLAEWDAARPIEEEGQDP